MWRTKELLLAVTPRSLLFALRSSRHLEKREQQTSSSLLLLLLLKHRFHRCRNQVQAWPQRSSSRAGRAPGLVEVRHLSGRRLTRAFNFYSCFSACAYSFCGLRNIATRLYLLVRAAESLLLLIAALLISNCFSKHSKACFCC